MDKERVRGFQKSFEASAQRSMTEHQKDVMYRCFLLELDEAAIKVVLSAETPCKEEYLIASFLDGIDMQFVEMELVPEHQISVIQEKRIDYLLDHLKTEDPQYRSLQSEVEQARRYRAIAEEQSEVLINRLKELRNQYKLVSAEMIHMQNEKQQLSLQIQKLEQEKNAFKRETQKTDPIPFPGREAKQNISEPSEQLDEPFSFRRKIKALVFGERGERTMQKEDRDGNMIELLCNPKYDLPQLRELQQGFFDGIPYPELKKIARPELPVEIIREMRLFLCKRYNLVSNETELPAIEEKENPVRHFQQEEIKEENLSIAEEEPEELLNDNLCDEDSPVYEG